MPDMADSRTPMAGLYRPPVRAASALVERRPPRSRSGQRQRGTAMPLTPIPAEAFTKIAVGIDRPEDVVVSPDGRVFASDHQCALAEIFPDGAFNRLGPRGGAPNGLNMDRPRPILL